MSSLPVKIRTSRFLQSFPGFIVGGNAVSDDLEQLGKNLLVIFLLTERLLLCLATHVHDLVSLYLLELDVFALRTPCWYKLSNIGAYLVTVRQ
jgi:hypothetical protein